LEIEKKLIKSCGGSVALYGSETCSLGNNEERVVNASETRCWRRMVKIKWTDRIMNDKVFQRAKEERLLVKILTLSNPMSDLIQHYDFPVPNAFPHVVWTLANR
jgi:hypothetical protein